MISVSTILIMIKNAKALSPIPNFYSWLLSLRWLSCPNPTTCHTVYIHQLSKLSGILDFNPVFYWWYSHTYEHTVCHHLRIYGNIKKHKAQDPSDRIQLKEYMVPFPKAEGWYWAMANYFKRTHTVGSVYFHSHRTCHLSQTYDT